VLPGGGIEHNESITEGIKREVLEEIGCQVTLIEKVGTYHPSNFLSEDLTFIYRGTIDQTPTISDEVADVNFFDIDDLPKMTLPTHIVWIEHALLPYPKNFVQKVPATSPTLFFKYLFLHPLLILKFIYFRLKKLRQKKTRTKARA